MGWLRYSDHKRFVDFLDKGKSGDFINLYKNKLINEWVEGGNQASEFAAKKAKIVIILARDSFHNKEEYLKKFEIERPNIHW
jgi:hypothetical protein